MSLFDETPSLSPVQFFAVMSDCLFLKGALKPEKHYLLPPTGDLLGEEAFADVYAGWNTAKLAFFFDVHSPFQKVDESDIRRGDSVELFLDTRDLKMKAAVSKFCHHFIFFPALSQNFYGREVTRFRTEDMHRLCHPEDLTITPQIERKGYTLSIEIPAHCLEGYDPFSFSRLGFTYRINRSGVPPQHFAVSSEEFVIEEHPATWGTLKLVKE